MLTVLMPRASGLADLVITMWVFWYMGTGMLEAGIKDKDK